jgi:hypothetical protein
LASRNCSASFSEVLHRCEVQLSFSEN